MTSIDLSCQSMSRTMRACPNCGSEKSYKLKKRIVARCANCGKDFSLTSGTPLHSRKMPLEKYGIAFNAFREGKTAIQVARLIGCNYRTAWRLRRVFIQNESGKDGHAKITA